MTENESNGVEETIVDDNVESPTTETSEEVTSQEVNTEEVDETIEEEVVEETPKEEVDKSAIQIANLNTALKQERASKREDAEKIAELQRQLDEINAASEVPEGDTYSESDINRLIEEKLLAKEKEALYAKSVEASKQQIKELEAEFDGTNGKPLYDDSLVFQWQKENNKTYLTPKEAFNLMKKDELIDYEVTKRLAKKKEVPKTVVKPSRGKESHNAKAPKTEGVISDEDMAAQIRQAINDSQAEL